MSLCHFWAAVIWLLTTCAERPSNNKLSFVNCCMSESKIITMKPLKLFIYSHTGWKVLFTHRPTLAAESCWFEFMPRPSLMFFAEQWLVTFMAHINQANSTETNCCFRSNSERWITNIRGVFLYTVWVKPHPPYCTSRYSCACIQALPTGTNLLGVCFVCMWASVVKGFLCTYCVNVQAS